MYGSGGSNELSSRARDIALTLTSWPSVTGSADEVAFAERLKDFLVHFDLVWTASILQDLRRNVLALKRGASRRTAGPGN